MFWHFPSFGYKAFDPSCFIRVPESILYAVAGEIVAPLISRNAVKAAFYNAKEKQVQALTDAIVISNDLFRSARANYMEVLMTQRDALESKLDLIETKMQQRHAIVHVYRALGGGWK